MSSATIIGIDLAKSSFQLHGASADGAVMFRKKVSRDRVLAFLGAHPKALVALEACASAHHWAREIAALGHEVKLIAPIYVKPFVSGKRTMRRMRRRSPKPPLGRRCASSRSSPPTSKDKACCSERATCWSVSARNR